MASTNGTASHALADLKAANDLLAERIRAARLERAERITRRRSLVETLTLDWVTPFADFLDLSRNRSEPIIAGAATFWMRRYGRDWPIFQTEQELALLRQPSRLLCATSDDAAGLIHGVGAYVIGSGYTYRPATRQKQSELPKEVLAALQRIVDEILEASEWKGGEKPGIEDECWWRSLEDGEFLIVDFPQEDGSTEFRIFEPEQLTQPPGETDWDWTFGVCADPADVQKSLAYWFQLGDTAADGEEFEPGRVTHFKRNGRRTQKRGRPDFSFQHYEKISLAGKLRLNLVDTACQQAAIPYVMEHENADAESVQAFRDDEADYTQTEPLGGETVNIRRQRRGEGQDIPKGQRYVDGPGVPYSDKHLAILSECLRGAVSRWNGFEWLISANAGNNNLPVDLSAESPFVRRVQKEQSRYTGAFKKPVWRAVEHAVRTRGLSVLGRSYSWEEIAAEVDLLVEAPSPETRNKLEEAQRAQIEIGMGVDSRQQYAQRQGRDWDQVAADNQEYQDTTGADGEVPVDGGGGAGGSTLSESLLEGSEWYTVGEYRTLLEDDRAGLVKKSIVNKGGKRQVVWVRPTEKPKLDPKPAPAADAPTADHVTAGLSDRVTAADPEDAKKPGLLAKVGDIALTVAAKAYTHLLHATPAIQKVLALLPDILDEPKDLGKIGYAPLALGTAAGQGVAAADPVRASLGISAHTAATIASHVLARGLVWVKHRLAGGKAEALESLLESDADAIAGAAEVLHAMLAAIAEELGLAAPPEADVIAGHLRKLLAG